MPPRLDVVRPGHLDLGVTSVTRWGVVDGLEVGTLPLTVWLYPQVFAKQRLLHRGRAFFSVEYRLSYPTRFLDAVAKEGDLGLLPPDTDVPQMLGAELGYNASYAWFTWRGSSARAPSPSSSNAQRLKAGNSQPCGAAECGVSTHWVTASARVLVAPRLSEAEPLPALDFPFLYQRFAAVYGPMSAVVAAHWDGLFGGRFYYHALAEYFLLAIEDAPGAWAWESALELGFAPGHFRFELGFRVAEARLPVGVRWHYLPSFDVGYRF